jgi:hypothetical protein
MNEKKFSANISAEEVERQYAEEHTPQAKPKKTQFDTKNYLQARLGEKETSKTLTIRLLPITPDSVTAFQKIHMHTVRVNKEISSSGWKTFVCPTKNKKDGKLMGDKCPFCELSTKARELKSNALDEPTKKKYGDIEFLNRAKDMWIVRCIERGHEEDGVKFWMFPDNRQGKGVHDQIMGLAEVRRTAAKAKGNDYSIFDLNNGLDLIINLKKGTDGKTAIQVLDGGFPCPLSDDFETGEKWIHDEKKWYEVYTVKPYDYMSIVAEGGVPVFSTEEKKYVNKVEADKLQEEADKQRMEEALTAQAKDYSEIAKPKTEEAGEVIDGSKFDTSEDTDDGLPF